MKKIFKKKTIIVILAGTIIGIALAIFPYNKVKAPPTITEKSLPTLPPPKISLLGESGYSIEIDPQAFSKLPKELPVYNISNRPYGLDKINELAQALGFSSTPIITQDSIVKETYIYSRGEAYLRIVPSLAIIDYKTGVLPKETIKQSPSQEEFVSLANSFLLDKSIVKQTNELDLFQFRELSIGPGGHTTTDKEQPNTISVSFVKKIDNFPIYASSYETGEINISFNANKEIISLYTDDIPQILEKQSYPTLSKDQLVTSLKLATLQSLNNGKVNIADLDLEVVQKARIKNITVAYLQEYRIDQTSLQPIYILQGDASLVDGTSVPVVFYLPALAPAAFTTP